MGNANGRGPARLPTSGATARQKGHFAWQPRLLVEHPFASSCIHSTRIFCFAKRLFALWRRADLWHSWLGLPRRQQPFGRGQKNLPEGIGAPQTVPFGNEGSTQANGQSYCYHAFSAIQRALRGVGVHQTICCQRRANGGVRPLARQGLQSKFVLQKIWRGFLLDFLRLGGQQTDANFVEIAFCVCEFLSSFQHEFLQIFCKNFMQVLCSFCLKTRRKTRKNLPTKQRNLATVLQAILPVSVAVLQGSATKYQQNPCGSLALFQTLAFFVLRGTWCEIVERMF